MIDGDAQERDLWEAGKSAFWLDPDRWHNVPFGMDGRLKPFWMYLDRRPTAKLSNSIKIKGVIVDTNTQAFRFQLTPAEMPVYRLDRLNVLRLVGWRPWPQ